MPIILCETTTNTTYRYDSSKRAFNDVTLHLKWLNCTVHSGCVWGPIATQSYYPVEPFKRLNTDWKIESSTDPNAATQRAKGPTTASQSLRLHIDNNHAFFYSRFQRILRWESEEEEKSSASPATWGTDSAACVGQRNLNTSWSMRTAVSVNIFHFPTISMVPMQWFSLE